MKFDEFLLNGQNLIEKHKDVRLYFAKTSNYEELELAKKEIDLAMKSGDWDPVPDDVINFFYEERKKQLGPHVKVRDKQESSKVLAIPADMQRTLSSQVSQQRPPWA